MASAHDAVITQQDIEVFTDGDCHILARELYEHTGWPMCVFGPCADGREHVFVMTPTGHALDVKGIHTLEALKKE